MPLCSVIRKGKEGDGEKKRNKRKGREPNSRYFIPFVTKVILYPQIVIQIDIRYA